MKKLILIPFLFISLIVSATKYYVAPTGTDGAYPTRGTFANPWKTWHYAFNNVTPSDTVYFRGGIYDPYSTTIGAVIATTTIDGTRNNPTCFFAYPSDFSAGNYPILDCQTMMVNTTFNNGILISRAHNLYFKGLTVINLRQADWGVGNANGITVWSEYGNDEKIPNNIKFENCVVHNIGGAGFYLANVDTAYFYNCDAYNCVDTLSSFDGITPYDPGGHGDGWNLSIHAYDQDNAGDSYVYFYGCRTWRCSDQGYAVSSTGKSVFDHCWAIENGNNPFSIVHDGITYTNNIVKGSGWKFWYAYDYMKDITICQVTLHNCIAAYNAFVGINWTDYEEVGNYEVRAHVYNNFIYGNGYDMEYKGTPWGFGIMDDDEHADYTGHWDHCYWNNISYNNLGYAPWSGDNGDIVDGADNGATNKFDLVGTTITDADFTSLDTTGMLGVGTRQADWSLPYTTFGRLASISECVDSGTDIGLDYMGTAPDMGWIEFEPIIADHTVIDYFDDIPAYWMNEVQKMSFVISGESHAYAYTYGLVNLESAYPAYDVYYNNTIPPETYTTDHLRASQYFWGDLNNATGWRLGRGEEDWYTSALAISRTKAGITYAVNSGREFSALGFGWCWDPEETVVDMPDYLAAMEEYITYCDVNGYDTKMFFTTGPVDGVCESGEVGYNKYLAYEAIRTYVKNDPTRILFDFADILCYNNSSETPNTTTWSGHTYPIITSQNELPVTHGHISDIGQIRLGKAIWWMLARIAGWDGCKELEYDEIEEAGPDYYISPTGSDVSGDGSYGSPWQTLYKATIEAITPGDIIHVASGNYYESTQMTLAVGVSIVGTTPLPVINTSGITSTYALLLSSGSSIGQSISYLKFDGNMTGYGAISVYARDIVSIHHCTFEDYRMYGVSFAGAGSNDNSFHDNVVDNCSGGINYGYGDEGMALKITQQTDFLCYNNTISQGTRGGGYDGVAIGGYEATYGTKIYNNDITWPHRDNTYFCFAIELWHPHEMEIYGNTIDGETDICKLVPDVGDDYTLYFHDNEIGGSSILSAVNYGLQLEANISGVIICNNLFKNLAAAMYFCNYTNFEVYDEVVEDLYIYSNVIYNIGITGSHFGKGIYFECGNNDDDKDPPYYYDNINIWNNTIVAYAAMSGTYGIDLPCHARYTSTMNIDIKNNIIVGFYSWPIGARQQDNDYSMAIDNLTIQDNILYGNGNSNNAYFTGVTLTNYTNDGGIKSDPLFVSSPTDLHLSSGSSPAYHTGTDVIPPYDLGDYDGVTWATPNPSIGAYEYVGTPPVVWYIDPAGSNVTGNGSALLPWQTLAYACSQVTTVGHTIHVNAGTYNETTNRANLAVGVNIVGEGATSVITYTYAPTSANDAAILLNSAVGTTEGNQSISYITIYGNSYTATRAICVNYRSNVAVHHCTITGFNYSGVTFDSSNDVYPNPPTSTYATGNMVHNCSFVDCTNRANESGQIRAMGQEGMLIHDNTFDADNRATGYNGNCITTNWNEALKIYDNEFYRPSDEGTGWNFFFEYWHCEGGDEVYDNTFNGGGVLDFVNVEKNAYDWGIKIYDNQFLIASQIAKGYRTIQAIDFEERGKYESVYIYNNYFKNYPNCIQLLATMNEEDVYIDDIYIYCNIMEDVGYSDYTSCYGIFVNGEQTSYDYYADNINIWNNTILNGSGTSNEGIRWQVCGTTTNVQIRNNIIQGFNNYPIRFAFQLAGGSVDIISVENNLYYDNGTDAANYAGATITNKTEQNNNTGDPNFVSSSDFHLTSLSLLAIDEGIDVGLVYDYDDESWGTPPSIGAYEYIGAAVVPTVTTAAVADILYYTATGGGNVTDDGGANVTDRGVCWNTAINPTILNDYNSGGSGEGVFEAAITGLDYNTLYYVRAYATNSEGTSYGNQVFFTTLNITTPTVTTGSVSSITQTTATGSGTITDDGGLDITARGVCWDTNPNPTTGDSFALGAVTNPFYAAIIGLVAGTHYYVRAFATNSEGTGYGADVEFDALSGTIYEEGNFLVSPSGKILVTSDGKFLKK